MRIRATNGEQEMLGCRSSVGFTISEMQEIDDWGFANRIRERSQAIRRLALLGLAQVKAESGENSL